MKIAVDAMGGDFAPHAVVAGAVEAAKEIGVGVILVGIEQTIQEELRKHPAARSLPIEIRNATQVVDMHDSPSTVFRRKKDSSIRVANNLVKSGEAVAVISAGNTGAAMATSLFVLGALEGVERPAIAVFMPTIKGSCLVLDMGANVDCKPVHLLQFGIMGEVFTKYLRKNPNPRVGLLSIGEEATKGNELTKEAFRLLKETSLNFIGNVEGRDMMMGKADVIVCDGFIGNVVLKISESVAESIRTILRENIGDNLIRKLGYFMMKPAFQALKRKVDYAEYGGAPLLGVNGVSIISHGRSSPRAIKNAVRVAAEIARSDVNKHIHEDIKRNMELAKIK
ncbi:MAG: phosphate acyltransferase [Nitrospirae bacterium GWC2_57_13]|nr:MAG: phosphate acyltransferase [Nitrospirae bacterium GWC2_57_13]OGW45016.1 MAG: phosphate acyltransferase [Nitrospirae bacterium GWD2_57_8]